MISARKLIAFQVLAIVITLAGIHYRKEQSFSSSHFNVVAKDVDGLSIGGIQVGQTIDEIRENLKPGWTFHEDRVLGDGTYIQFDFDEANPKTVTSIHSNPIGGLCYDQYLILPRESMPSPNSGRFENLTAAPSSEHELIYFDPRDGRAVHFLLLYGDVKFITLGWKDDLVKSSSSTLGLEESLKSAKAAEP